jgi:hypothetical protein
METRKLLGCTVDLPIIAPMSAPAEDKKLILTQTRDKIAEAGASDWQAKTHLLAQRFVVPVPNASNEAKVRLERFRDWTSPVFSYGIPSPLGVDMSPTEFAQTTILRYLSFEMRIHPRNAPALETPVPDLPNERCLQVVLKVPLNDEQTDVCPGVSLDMLRDPRRIIQYLQVSNSDVTFGKPSPSRIFDTTGFDKDFRNILGECMFKAVYAVLLRDYVGKGIVKDMQKRLRDCRQVTWDNGKRRVKTVAEQHADFMRLVQEFDVDEEIPANLPNIAYHNASWDMQQELTTMKYEPPAECRTTAIQYQKLAEFYEKATEAEARLGQLESVVRRIGGTRTQGSASSFLTRLAPQDEAYLNETAETSGNWAHLETQADHPIEDFRTQNRHLRTMLSIAEKAIRKASGEVAPLECWGCKDLPEFDKDKYHRYKSCPRRDDPKVRANFEKNLRLWTSSRRQNRSQERHKYGNPARRTGDQQSHFPKQGNRSFLSKPNTHDTGEEDPSTPPTEQLLGDISDEANLLTEFGITQEGMVNPSQNNPRCNVAFRRSYSTGQLPPNKRSENRGNMKVPINPLDSFQVSFSWECSEARHSHYCGRDIYSSQADCPLQCPNQGLTLGRVLWS